LTVSALLTRMGASDSFLLFPGHVAPFYALSPDGGCPPNRGKPNPPGAVGSPRCGILLTRAA
jgi:hypothetical protein